MSENLHDVFLRESHTLKIVDKIAVRQDSAQAIPKPCSNAINPFLSFLDALPCAHDDNVQNSSEEIAKRQ